MFSNIHYSRIIQYITNVIYNNNHYIGKMKNLSKNSWSKKGKKKPVLQILKF